MNLAAPDRPDHRHLDALRGKTLTPAQSRWLIERVDQLLAIEDDRDASRRRAEMAEERAELAEAECRRLWGELHAAARIAKESDDARARAEEARSIAEGTIADLRARGEENSSLKVTIQRLKDDGGALDWLERAKILGDGDIRAFVRDARKRLGEYT
jgi:hypothetical protein